MNGWLLEVVPAFVWLWLYLASTTLGGLSLFYILEQLVVYGAGHFPHVAVAFFRVTIVFLVVCLFIGWVNAAARGIVPQPLDVLQTTGLAMLALVTAVTHRRHNHFPK